MNKLAEAIEDVASGGLQLPTVVKQPTLVIACPATAEARLDLEDSYCWDDVT